MTLPIHPPQVRPAAELQADDHTPVVIVGAGACGLTAALALHRLGVDCVVLERDAFPAGSTALSSGFIPAPGTRAQASQGITDSVALFARDIQGKAHGHAAEHLVQAYATHIGPALDALEQHHGLPWQVLDNFLYPGHSAHRMHAVPEKTGAGLMSRLQAAADAAGVVVLTQAQVTELWADAQQRVHGVGFVRPGGGVERLRCDAVMLACNGFGGAPDKVRKLLPDMAEATYAGHAGNDGSAIDWGEQLGARLADLTAYQGHGSWAVPQGALISWALMMEGGVQINALGQRFHDETQGYSEAAVHVLAQPGGVAWNVFDDALLAFAQGFPDFVAAQEAGAVQHAADVAALAQLVGCSAQDLQQTLDGVQPGTDPLTGRVFKRALQAPLHAIRVTGALFHTQGGLDIDAQARVLRQDGTPLPNLLAAGGAARGVSGNAVWGYLSGNGLLSAIAGGHIAAHTAANTMLQRQAESPKGTLP
jgi:fumarate reductase flavoprotein subunit